MTVTGPPPARVNPEPPMRMMRIKCLDCQHVFYSSNGMVLGTGLWPAAAVWQVTPCTHCGGFYARYLGDALIRRVE